MAYTPDKDIQICTYASGSSGLQNVEVDGSYPPPRWSFKPYSQQITMGDGTVRGSGWPTAEWTWDIISAAQRAWLRVFIPGQSADLYIRTRTPDSPGTGLVFRCVGIWPIESEELDFKRSVKFTIAFQRMVRV